MHVLVVETITFLKQARVEMGELRHHPIGSRLGGHRLLSDIPYNLHSLLKVSRLIKNRKFNQK